VAAGAPRRLIGIRLAGASLLAVGAIATGATPAVALLDVWTISASPTTVQAGEPTTVKFTVTNKGAILDNDIGCLEVSIPGSFEVLNTGVVDTPSGKSWDAGDSGGSGSGRVARFRAESDSDALEGGLLAGDESAVLSVRVDAGSAGSSTWAAHAWSDRDCDGGLFAAKSISITVSPVPTPNPSPTPNPTPTPKPTPAPTPTPRPTPSPLLPTLPPLPSLLPTRPPTATPRPDASPTPIPRPTSTPDASDQPAPSDRPSTPSASPTAAATPPPGSGSATPAPSDDPDSDALPPVTAGGSGPGDAGPGSRLRIGRDPDGGVGTGPEIDVSFAAMEGLGNFSWAVPSLVLAVPGLLLVLAVLAQAVGGVLWLPVIRRRIGSFGVGGRRRA
jgi:hypothetical protein